MDRGDALMREVVLRIPRAAVEDVLDRLLPIVPAGVREAPAGRRVELRMRGSEVPGIPEIARAVGRWPHRIEEHEVPDDWRERRLADYRAEIVANRLVVRPDWAPAPAAGLMDVVLCDSAAFGAGTHPTTRACLEVLLEIPASGSFADLGCGSGVLAIVAFRRGFSPVTAVDIQPGSVAATVANAAANGVVIEPRRADLSIEPPPPADAIAANVPPELHRTLARTLERVPRVALLSGFLGEDLPGVLECYGERGLHAVKCLDAHGWAVALVERV
jgi:ribosomal protein L11 methyltransferase